VKFHARTRHTSESPEHQDRKAGRDWEWYIRHLCRVGSVAANWFKKSFENIKNACGKISIPNLDV
jgi:hypothetical protein